MNINLRQMAKMLQDAVTRTKLEQVKIDREFALMVADELVKAALERNRLELIDKFLAHKPDPEEHKIHNFVESLRSSLMNYGKATLSAEDTGTLIGWLDALSVARKEHAHLLAVMSNDINAIRVLAKETHASKTAGDRTQQFWAVNLMAVLIENALEDIPNFLAIDFGNPGEIPVSMLIMRTTGDSPTVTVAKLKDAIRAIRDAFNSDNAAAIPALLTQAIDDATAVAQDDPEWLKILNEQAAMRLEVGRDEAVHDLPEDGRRVEG